MIDWDRLLDTVSSRSLNVPSAVTFQYLRDKLGFEIPGELMSRLASSLGKNPLGTWAGLLQARPKERARLFGRMLRGVAKKYRKISAARSLSARPRDQTLRIRKMVAARLPVDEPATTGAFVRSCRLNCPPDRRHDTRVRIEMVLDVQPSLTSRRIELEINSAVEHLCRIRLRKRAGQQGPLRFLVTGSFPNVSSVEELELVSRPSRQLRSYASDAERDRYDSVGFRVVSCKVA
jgi:hypothetical protein